MLSIVQDAEGGDTVRLACASRFDLPIDPTRAKTFNLRLDFAA
jgi:hypothetical protein